MCFEDCCFYTFCCCLCQTKQYRKRMTTRQKDLSELTAITPNRPSTFTQYTDPMMVKTSQMTKTYNLSPSSQYKNTTDVLKKEGYKMGDKIDSGAFATVFKATHIKKGTVVAIKIIDVPPDLNSEKSKKKRAHFMSDIKNELFILEKSSHPHIIHLITHFLVRDTNRELLHIVMQYAEGGTLSNFSEKQGPFDEISCRVWFAQMLSALSFMHERHGIAHRDLKLSNILLDKDEDILISDFGLSRVVWRKSGEGILQSKTFCGTPPYMAPELLENYKDKQGYNAQKVDVFALGVILYKLFNKEYPFPQRRSKAIKKMKAKKYTWSPYIRHQPSAEFRDIIDKLFEPDVDKRPDMKTLKQHIWIQHLMVDEKEMNSKSIRQRDKEHRSLKQ